MVLKDSAWHYGERLAVEQGKDGTLNNSVSM
jgi:hypothetical protein